MRITLIYIVLLMLTIPAATAQQKYYYTLGSKFKGLRKDQIKIIPTWTYEVTRAEFVYNQQKYKAYFNQDSNLTSIAMVKNIALCPADIKKDLSCIYRTYKIMQWVEKEYYEKGLITKKQTEVVISGYDKYNGFEVWEYKGGARSGNGWPVEFRDGDYSEEYLLIDGGMIEDGSNWPGGSFEAFKDSVKKYVKAPDLECRRKFMNQKLSAYIFVSSKGEPTSYGFSVAAPYLLKEQFEKFCHNRIFPVENSSGRYHYSFNVILSEKNEIEVVE
jgi:hypothetical protein